MVLKLVFLLVSLLLLVFGIYEVCENEYNLDTYAEEYNVLCVLGGIIWCIGLILASIYTFCGCGGPGFKIGITMIIGGITMFFEPFIHYLIFKNN